MLQAKNGLWIVIGLGKTGLSCIRYLIANNADVMVMDTRSSPPLLPEFISQFPNVPYFTDELDETRLLQATTIVVSPGVPIAHPAIQKAIIAGIPVVGDIELFAQATKVPVIAITGTNGKSTVTELTGALVNACQRRAIIAGNIGTPVLDLLVNQQENCDLYVLELSSFQLETTYSLLPRAATILNVTVDHGDRYNSFAEYVAAKQRIYHNCAVAVWNRDDQMTYSPTTTSDMISFGSDEPGEEMFGLREKYGVTYLAYGSENIIPVNELKLKGKHNWMNALAALTLGHAIALPLEQMVTALRSFSGLPHRCQLVRERNGISWYNDSKATNIGACMAAINGLSSQVDGKIVLIAGGQGKGADFSELNKIMNEKIRGVIVMGEDAPLIKQAIAKYTTVIDADNLKHAIDQANEFSQQGDAVLLAPACASFDMFRDFNHRGEVFIELVNAL